MTPTAAQAEARRIVREARRLADLRTRVDPDQPTPDWRIARDAALTGLIAAALTVKSRPARVERFLAIVLIPALVWAAALALAAAVIISAMRFFQ